MAGFDANDRILLGIEGSIPPEHFYSNGVGLYPAPATGQGFLGDMRQEAMFASSCLKVSTLEDTIDLDATILCRENAFPRCIRLDHNSTPLVSCSSLAIGLTS